MTSYLVKQYRSGDPAVMKAGPSIASWSFDADSDAAAIANVQETILGQFHPGTDSVYLWKNGVQFVWGAGIGG